MKPLSEDTIKQALDLFDKWKIVRIKDLANQMQASERTIFRYLKQWKTYTSYNFNGSYYTLSSTPRFDKNGLWEYKDAKFSKYGGLISTIKQLVDHSTKILC